MDILHPPSAAHTTRPRVLVVDDEPDLIDVVRECVAGDLDADWIYADTLVEARRLMADAPVDLLLADIHLPDGDGTSLISELRAAHPAAGAIVMTGKPSMQRAISAIRDGAVDFVPKPFTGMQIAERVRAALGRKSQLDAQDRKIERLKLALRKLNDARKTVSQKVDLLCNDLISAYGELSRDLSVVRDEEAFRKTIAQAKGLEQMLCHAMDWLLRKLGYSNVAVWLAADAGEFQLGAYMKYTLAGDPLLTNALKRAVLPMLKPDAATAIEAASLRNKLDADEYKLFAGQTFAGTVCTYLGESLASIVFFRSESAPFTENDLATLQAVAPAFAIALASVVGDGEARGEGEFGADGDSGTNGGLADGRRDGGFDDPPRKSRRDAHRDDWWKRGEPPPF